MVISRLSTRKCTAKGRGGETGKSGNGGGNLAQRMLGEGDGEVAKIFSYLENAVHDPTNLISAADNKTVKRFGDERGGML